MGKVYFKYGCMNSGKSMMLLSQAFSLDEQGVAEICLKPAKDTRGESGFISSRTGMKKECVMIEDDLDILHYMDSLYLNFRLNVIDLPKWVFVDECQFLSPEQVDQLAEFADTSDVNVVCYGLRTDFTGKLFPGSRRLMEIADTIEEIKMSCACGRKAIMNARFDDNGIVTEGEVVAIGDKDMYKSVCRKCYRELTGKFLRQEE